MNNSTPDNPSRTNQTPATTVSSVELERSGKKDDVESKNPTDIEALFGEVIFSYTRAQAIEDGVLIDVSEIAREAKFSIPVAITAAVYSRCVQWTQADIEAKGDSEDGRLWDVVFMANHAIRTCSSTDNTLNFIVAAVPSAGDSWEPKEAELKMTVSGGDHGEPVITIMLPNED